jgi:hypothetical protein
MSAADTGAQPSKADVARSSARPTAAPDDPSSGIDAFLIARGGPYYDLQHRLGLLTERALNAGRRAAILVGLAWGVPLLLSALAGDAIGPAATRPFLLELGAWARFVIAIGIFVLMERMVEERLRMLLRQFARAPLLAPAAMPVAAAAVVRALRRRDARLAEVVCLVAAYAITLANSMLLLDANASTSLVTVAPDGTRLTPAGWWCLLVSNPLFLFLLLRWLWRYLVWALLLREVARLELRLVATHPDGAGGLAFIGHHPNVFAAFVFALSCVLGAVVAHTLLRDGMTTATYGQLMVAWLAFVIILLGAPLLAFSKPLRQLKNATLLAAGSVSTRRERALERDVLGTNMAAGSAAEATPTGEVPDASKTYAAAQKLSTVLISRTVVVPVAAAALLPLVAAGATQLPVRELLKVAKGLILL